MEFLMEQYLWKVTAEMGRHQQEGLHVVGAYKGIEETVRRKGYPQENYGRGRCTFDEAEDKDLPLQIYSGDRSAKMGTG